jgi:hypothetical protein
LLAVYLTNISLLVVLQFEMLKLLVINEGGGLRLAASMAFVLIGMERGKGVDRGSGRNIENYQNNLYHPIMCYPVTLA